MTKYNNIYSKSMTITLKYNNISTKNLKHTIAMHFQELLPKKTTKYGPQIKFTTKHCMFGWKVYLSPENFTQQLVAMVVTFCMSVCILYLYCDERRDIRWNIVCTQGISWGLRLYFIVFPYSSHNTDIVNYKFIIDLSGR